MTRLGKDITKETAHIESLRERVEDEGRAYMEQQCPICKRWVARFNGSKMADGSTSNFTACPDCRVVVLGFTGVEDMWGELPGTASAEWLERVSEIGRKAEVKAARMAG